MTDGLAPRPENRRRSISWKRKHPISHRIRAPPSRLQPQRLRRSSFHLNPLCPWLDRLPRDERSLEKGNILRSRRAADLHWRLDPIKLADPFADRENAV